MIQTYSILVHQFSSTIKAARSIFSIFSIEYLELNPYFSTSKNFWIKVFEFSSIHETILNDKNKFIKLNDNPTDQLKSKINKLINANNADLHNIKLPKIIGDYKPGYIYGTVKIHKPGNPLRPIISHVTTPTYQLTKTINNLIPFP